MMLVSKVIEIANGSGDSCARSRSCVTDFSEFGEFEQEPVAAIKKFEDGELETQIASSATPAA